MDGTGTPKIVRDIEVVLKKKLAAIKVNLHPLEENTAFLYLGQTITYNDSD